MFTPNIFATQIMYDRLHHSISSHCSGVFDLGISTRRLDFSQSSQIMIRAFSWRFMFLLNTPLNLRHFSIYTDQNNRGFCLLRPKSEYTLERHLMLFSAKKKNQFFCRIFPSEMKSFTFSFCHSSKRREVHFINNSTLDLIVNKC